MRQQGGGDGLDRLADALGGHGVAVELGELAAQDEQVEALGVLVVVAHGRGQAGEVLEDLGDVVLRSRSAQVARSA